MATYQLGYEVCGLWLFGALGVSLFDFENFRMGFLGFRDVAVRSVRATQSFGRKRLQASR